jgi:hypothetical protein
MSNYSDFWLKDNHYEWDWEDELDAAIEEESGTDATVDVEDRLSDTTARLIRLSSARRAVANYVSILTNQNIPVVFNDSAVNCTDGKLVYISSDITKKDNFDVAVGLALHEGSHIKYSDFELFKTVWMNVPRDIYNYTEKLSISKDEVGKTCQTILNYVEDRFIDYTVHRNAPGYRGYYDALYDEYFNNKVISDALDSDMYRTLSVESYMYRIINLTNPNTNLKALPGLYDIAKELDLTNINRLTTPKDRLNVAYKIAEIVFKNINEHNQKQTGTGFDQNDSGVPDNSNGMPGDGESGKSTDDVLGGTESTVTSDNAAVTTDVGTDANVSKTKQSKIAKSFEKQKDFLAGKIKKKKVSKREKTMLDVLEKSQIDLVPVAQEMMKASGFVGSVECILVKNMTKELILSEEFPMSIGANNESSRTELQKNVDAGIVLGTKLGRRLQIRNEINIDKFTRRNLGKIDKRLMHELGFETDTNIFYSTFTNKYKKVNFHISVDASASMRGPKWNRTIKLCVALAKATSMIDNVDLTISFRTTMSYNPYIVVAYNSKVDKFSKIKNLFSYLIPVNTTPEGLCFEALMKFLPKSDTNTNSYFVNISDGEPCFYYTNTSSGIAFSYRDKSACEHTRTQVRKIKESGYNIISYFVSDYDNFGIEVLRQNFKTMYGSDSHFINVENLNQIVKTVNSKMMEAIDI